MRKVRFLKDHVNGIKKGQEGEFNDGRANYLVRVGVAEFVDETSSKTSTKKSKSTSKAKPDTAKSEPCKTC